MLSFSLLAIWAVPCAIQLKIHRTCCSLVDGFWMSPFLFFPAFRMLGSLSKNELQVVGWFLSLFNSKTRSAAWYVVLPVFFTKHQPLKRVWVAPPSTMCESQAVKNASLVYTWSLPLLAPPKTCRSTLRRAPNTRMILQKQNTQLSILFGLSSSVSLKPFLDQPMLFLSLLSSSNSI